MTSIPFIFIHIGKDIFPEYVIFALNQCHYWNPDNPIYFISSKIHKPKLKNLLFVKHVFIEDIPFTQKHNHFIRKSKLNMSFRNGFWRYTTERLFLLEDFCYNHNIHEFFHLENDNMLYFNANDMISIFRETIKGISAPALSMTELTFGIMYCNDLDALSKLTMELLTPDDSNEMQKSSRFFNKNKLTTRYLPSIPLSSAIHLTEDQQYFISNNFDKFKGIFDPAQYGQWIGGIDPRNGPSVPFTFSNTATLVQPNKFEYRLGDDNRYYIKDGGEEFPIYLLHIHSKKLDKFISYA